MITNKIQEQKILRNWSDSRTSQVQHVLKDYEQVHNKTFDELLHEAEQEEEQNVKKNKRSIKQRIITYTIHLRERGCANSTIHQYTSIIKQLYTYEDIEIPTLPRFTRQDTEETFADLVTKEEIQKAITHTNTKMKAIITTLASSGMRRGDLCKLTVQDFFKATRDYHKREIIHDNEIFEVIEELSRRSDVIPIFEILSEKTSVAHLTFCSVEASQFILQMLRERYMKEEVTLTDTLFDICKETVTMNFERLGDRLGFGWKEHRRRFHPHALRSFFATTLTNNDVDFLSTEFLLGHTLKRVQASYYYANPLKLRERYSRVMDELCFTVDVEYVDLNVRERDELERLRSENEAFKKKLYEIEEVVSLLRDG